MKNIWILKALPAEFKDIGITDDDQIRLLKAKNSVLIGQFTTETAASRYDVDEYQLLTLNLDYYESVADKLIAKRGDTDGIF
tara:strand:- start:9177 stop:9422 length:246 start_codon:yes stop_codon:yes gene_type:complete